MAQIDAAAAPVERMTNRELFAQVLQTTILLARKEVELARTELRADVKQELAMAKGLGVAGVCAISALNLMLVAVVFALSRWMPDWAAALLVAGAVLLVGTVAGLIGWGKRVRRPLEATWRTLKEDARWAKARIA